MRILFLNDLWDPRIGSSVRQMYQLGSALRARGHETTLLSCTQTRADVGEADVLGMRVVRLYSDYDPRWRSWIGLDNPRVRRGVADVLASVRPDVAHSHLIHAHLSYASLTAARRAGAAVVFTAHDVMTFCYQKLTCFHGGEAAGGRARDYAAYWQKCIPCQRLRYNPWRNARIKRVLARDVQRFTAVSDELATAIRANGITVHRTIHNAIELQPRMPSAEEVARFRERFGLTDRLVIAIGGRLHEQKGVEKLLRMVALLAPRFPTLRLLVMGKREIYEREFEPRARALGVAERVVATGWLDGLELQSAYAATDVFVTPSICFDTFGMVNLEAMEHKKPVVATVFGGSPEVVLQGASGFVENPFDVEAFAGRIGQLLEDPLLRRAQGDLGHARLLELFGIPRLCDEFCEEYELARASLGSGETLRTGRDGGR